MEGSRELDKSQSGKPGKTVTQPTIGNGFQKKAKQLSNAELMELAQLKVELTGTREQRLLVYKKVAQAIEYNAKYKNASSELKSVVKIMLSDYEARIQATGEREDESESSAMKDEQIGKLNERLLELEKKLNSSKETEERQKRKIGELEKKLKERPEADLNEHAKEVKKLKAMVDAAKREQITDESVRTMLAEKDGEIDMAHQIIHEKATAYEELERRLKELEKARDELNIELAVKRKEIDQLNAKEKESNAKLIEELKNQVNETLSYSISETLNESMNTKRTDHDEEVAELRSKAAELGRALREKEKAIQDLQHENVTLRESVREAEEMLRDKNQLLREANVELEGLKRRPVHEPETTGGETNKAIAAEPQAPSTSWAQTLFPTQSRSAGQANQDTWLTNNVQIRDERTRGAGETGRDRPVRSNSQIASRSSQRIPRAKPNLIAVCKKKGGLLDPNEILKRVKDLLQPLINDVEFEDVYQNRNGKTIIKFVNRNDGGKIMNAIAALDDEIERWTVGEKRRIVIKQIDSATTKAELLRELRERNDIDLKDEQLYVLNSTSYSYLRAIITLEEEEAKKILREKDRVKIGFKTCPIDKHVKPLQCFVCGGFNHSGYRNGKVVCENEPRCLDCAQPKTAGHQCKSDQNQKQLECVNCKSTAHSASDRACPIYQKIHRELHARW